MRPAPFPVQSGPGNWHVVCLFLHLGEIWACYQTRMAQERHPLIYQTLCYSSVQTQWGSGSHKYCLGGQLAALYGQNVLVANQMDLLVAVRPDVVALLAAVAANSIGTEECFHSHRNPVVRYHWLYSI